MWKGKSLITGHWGIPTLSGSERYAFSPSYYKLTSLWKFPNQTFPNCIGHFNTYSSGHCYGICIWRRAIWTHMQCWAVQRGWGSYPMHCFCFQQQPRLLSNAYCLRLQARFFFQQLISGVSYCHTMVFESFLPFLVCFYFCLPRNLCFGFQYTR